MLTGLRHWLYRNEYVAALCYLAVAGVVAIVSASALLGWKGSRRVYGALERLAVKAVNHRRGAWESEYARACAMADQGDAPGATRAFESLAGRLPFRSRFSPDGVLTLRAWTRLAQLYEAQGDQNQCRAAYENLLAKDPSFSLFESLYGRALLRMGPRDEGEQHLLACLETDPNFTASVEALIQDYHDSGRMREAVETYDRYMSAVSVMPMRTDSAMGVSLIKQGEVAGSLNFAPVVDGQLRAYCVPVSRAGGAPQRDAAGKQIDSFSLNLYLTPDCGAVTVQSVAILPPRSLFDANAKPLAVVADFREADLQGLAPASAATSAGAAAEGTVFAPTSEHDYLPDYERQQWICARRVSILAALPAPIDLKDIDAVEVKMAASKRLAPEIRHIVEQARRFLDAKPERRPSSP